MNDYQQKHDSKLSIWMERLEISVDGQQVLGNLFHVDSADILVAITSPFEGFNKSLHIASFARSAFPDGFNSDHWQEQGKALLRELFLQYKDHASILEASKAKEVKETKQNDY